MRTKDCKSGVVIPYLRAWRLWLGISQREVAYLARMTHHTVELIERGERVRQGALAKLERGLGISEYELLHTPPEED